MLTNFGRFILIFKKMALIFSRSTYRFYHFKLQVLRSQNASTLSLIMSAPNLSNLNPLDYQVWKQCWSLITGCNRSQNQFPNFKMH